MSHSHGDPAVECTIPRCRYPRAKFLCGVTMRGWRAGMTLGLCILPSTHREQSAHYDQEGNSFPDSACNQPVVHLLVIDPDNPEYDETFARCCRYNWRVLIGTGLITSMPGRVTCTGR